MFTSQILSGPTLVADSYCRICDAGVVGHGRTVGTCFAVLGSIELLIEIVDTVQKFVYLIVQRIEFGQDIVIYGLQVAEVHRLLAFTGASGGGEVEGAVGAHIVENGGYLQTTVGGHHIVTV